MDGDSIYIFVNGVRENAVAHNVAIPELNNEFRIGGGLSNNTEYFFGDITGVRFWNVARSASDINGNMSSCIPASSNGLVAMYNMADGSGSTIVTDESLNGYNGMLMNMDENTVWQNTNMQLL
jgi:hypothetical protein